MDSVLKIILGIGLTFFTIFNAMAAKNEVNFSDPKQAIIATAESSTITLTLPANPSTGFCWFLVKYDQNFIEPISQKYYATKTDRVGAGGYERWKFKIKSKTFNVPIATEIQMLYARPWGRVDSKSETFNIFIK
jgi:predicted secreted protein